MTTVLSITHNNNFLVTPLQDASEAEIPFAEAPPTSSSVGTLSAVIQPLRVNIRKGQTGLHLLALIDQPTTGDAERPGRKPASRVEVQEVSHEVVYPAVPGVSAEKVKQLIDAFLRGGKWRDMPGNIRKRSSP